MAVACVETMLPIWQAPVDLQEALLEAWWQQRKEAKQKTNEGEWERKIGGRA